MIRRLLAVLLGALAFAFMARCGGSGDTPAPRGRMDVDSGEVTGGGKPKPKRPAAPTVQPGDIAVLSLEGIPMPAPPPEAGAAAGPATGEGDEEDEEASGPLKAPTAQPQKAQAAPDPNAPPPRNLFSFEEDPAVVAERKRVADEAAAKANEAARKAEEARRKWQGPPRPPPPPQPPAIPFQFIGYMGPPENRIGVFTGPNTFLAKNGDVVQTRFKIVSIGYESAEIGFTGFAQTQRIPLTAGGK